MPIRTEIGLTSEEFIFTGDSLTTIQRLLCRFEVSKTDLSHGFPEVLMALKHT